MVLYHINSGGIANIYREPWGGGINEGIEGKLRSPIILIMPPPHIKKRICNSLKDLLFKISDSIGQCIK